MINNISHNQSKGILISDKTVSALIGMQISQTQWQIAVARFNDQLPNHFGAMPSRTNPIPHYYFNNRDIHKNRRNSIDAIHYPAYGCQFF
ncbi:MAG: hypothetical protein ABTQ25_09595 [Nitrosomonas ureae]